MTDLTVNGALITLGSDGDTSLLTALRDELGLVGTRFGCRLGLCGACFVKVGNPVMPACQTPVWQVAGQSVTTVEGLSRDGRPHPVRAGDSRPSGRAVRLLHLRDRRSRGRAA